MIELLPIHKESKSDAANVPADSSTSDARIRRVSAMPTMKFKGKQAQAVFDALTAPPKIVPTHCDCGREKPISATEKAFKAWVRKKHLKPFQHELDLYWQLWQAAVAFAGNTGGES